jgi:glycogen phosphorylase
MTTVPVLKQAILENLRYVVAKDPEFATDMDYFMAIAYTVRDRILARWLATRKRYSEHNVRLVCYLSAEFLLGPHLANNLLNLQGEAPLRQATKELGIDLDRIIAEESEPGLGNGGLGRLAACYLDSLATVGIPAIGHGIRYEFGMFHQEIHDGWQVELTDYWLRYGNPWEIRRPQAAVDVFFGGHTESWKDSHGALKTRWIPASMVTGIPYDTPILGYASGVANDLRLWKSEAGEFFISISSTAATIKGRLRRRILRRISPKSSIRMTRGLRASSCAWSSNIFSSPVRCRIWFAYTCVRADR